MVKNVARQHSAVADVVMAKGADEYFSTVERSCWQRALSVRSYLSKSSTAVVWAYQREEILAAVDPTRISDVSPGFDGGMNVVADRVL